MIMTASAWIAAISIVLVLMAAGGLVTSLVNHRSIRRIEQELAAAREDASKARDHARNNAAASAEALEYLKGRADRD